MYCLTYVNNLNCILNELSLWSEISSEHPIFIKTVAILTNKNLSKGTLDKLTESNKMFSILNNHVKQLNNSPIFNYLYYINVKNSINDFLLHDKHFIQLIPEVMQYGTDDKVWQTLLEHINHEQNFMYKLFTDLKMQL